VRRHISPASWVGCIVSVMTLLSAPCDRGPLLAEEAASEVTNYMPIPIVGHLGDEVVPKGIETCLREAARNPRIKHIVFRIKSRAGNFEAAESIRSIVQKYDDRFQYHALVEDAIGPAVCLVVCCDTIHMTEGSSVGGEDAQSGSRISSALAVSVGSVARKKKRDFTLVRAMLMPEAQAHVWEDKAGKVHIDPLPPQGASPDKMILRVGRSALLTLPRDYAVKVGFARAGVEKAEGLGPALGLSGWRAVMSHWAAGVMNRLRSQKKKEAEQDKERLKKLEANTETRNGLRQYIEQKQKEAVENDPGRFLYKYQDPDDPIVQPEMTPASRRRWRERTKECIHTWEDVIQKALQLEAFEQEAVQLGGKRLMSKLVLKTICERATDEIQRLEEQRTRCEP